MHCMALSFFQHVVQGNSYPMIPDSWLHKMAGARKDSNNELGKFHTPQLWQTYKFV